MNLYVLYKEQYVFIYSIKKGGALKKKINTFNLSTIGAKIKALRDERDLSMRELASRAGVAVSFISKIESGKTSPTIMTLQKILDAMSVPVVEFFNNNKEICPSNNIIFNRKNMKALQGSDRRWLYAFPPVPDIKAVMTYEEFEPKTKAREVEWHPKDMFGYVLSGELTLDLPDKGKFKAKKGEAFYIKAGTEHIAGNAGDKVLKMIVVELNQ